MSCHCPRVREPPCPVQFWGALLPCIVFSRKRPRPRPSLSPRWGNPVARGSRSASWRDAKSQERTCGCGVRSTIPSKSRTVCRLYHATPPRARHSPILKKKRWWRPRWATIFVVWGVVRWKSQGIPRWVFFWRTACFVEDVGVDAYVACVKGQWLCCIVWDGFDVVCTFDVEQISFNAVESFVDHW